MQGAVLVDSGERRDEVFFECCDGALGGVDPVVVGGDKVNVHVIFLNVCRDGFRAFVVHHVECGVIVVVVKRGKDVGECANDGVLEGMACTRMALRS